jgi:hypothetical protein
MTKTFEETISCDTSWTGGRNEYYDDYLEKLDTQINDYAIKNNLKVVKVYFSTVNKNTQHGSHPTNTTRVINCIACVRYRKLIFNLF